MNMEMFRLINNLAYKNILLDKIMIFCSKDLWYVYIALVIIVFIQGIVNKNSDFRKIAFSTFVLTGLNLCLSFLIGNIYYIDRPFVHNKVNMLLPHVADASFPSDHATGTMSIAVGLGQYNKILGTVLTILSILVGLSRVYVGNHYPLDILGAYLLVFAASYIYRIKLRSNVENFYEIIEKKVSTKLGMV